MPKGIGIVDTSGQWSETRAKSLKDRIKRQGPSESAPPGLSWATVTCSPNEISTRISEFWLVWVHNSAAGWDLDLTLKAAVAQETNSSGLQHTILVTYGGGIGGYPFPSGTPSPQELAVLSRMIKTEDKRQEVLNFWKDQALNWNLEGFLRRAAESYPDIDRIKLLDLLCDGTWPDSIPSSSIVHSTNSIVLLLEGEMYEALQGCAAAKAKFSNKIPTIVRAINDLLLSSDRAVVIENTAELFQRLKEGLFDMKKSLERLQEYEDWADANCHDIAKLLESLNAICQEFSSTAQF